ncbi:MAG: rod shape-determining protein MreD [Bacteroidales bacterium]|nr:rod shape-determining protein MreD [Bacteroidales bacterium]
MNRIYLKYSFTFIILVLVQIFLFDKINLWHIVTPMIYISFIFSLPYQTPQWVVILLGFFIGLTVDFFTGVLGLHALATLIISFIRPFVIHIIPLRVEREEHLRPIFYDMKFIWYLQYAFLLTLIHHFIFFFVDKLSFHNFWQTIIVVLSNTGCSVICIFVIQILFYRSSKRY